MNRKEVIPTIDEICAQYFNGILQKVKQES
jgi:hypothetical protein